jgi:DNA-binding transcriptional MocR family regulator
MFGISTMQISRAVKQLTALGLIYSRKEGVRIIISGTEPHRALFDKAKPYLLNPVRKKIYIERGKLPRSLPLSGYSALSELTMLNNPETETFAFYGKAGELTGTDTLIDNKSQAEVEIWKYEPVLLSKHQGIADAFSIAASLLSADDERVEQSLDELISGYFTGR